MAIQALWVASCLIASAYALLHLDEDGHGSTLLWTYFQPVVPPLVMLWLWAETVAHFERTGVPYATCFPPADRRQLPSSAGLRQLAAALTTLCLTGFACCALLCAPPLGAPAVAPLAVPPLLYMALLGLLLAPYNRLARPGRRLFARTLLRVLGAGTAWPVSWSDFLLADMATSLAKSTGDAVRAACLVLHGPWSHPSSTTGAVAHARTCGPLSWHALVFLVLPYGLRLVQCLSVWRRGGPAAQVANAAKYLSSFPALVLTAMEHEAHKHKLPFPHRRAWLVASTFNSLYSAYWDVEQDWDMPWLVKPGGRRLGPLRLPRRRRDALYPPAWYAWLLASNAVLRFSWAHRLFGDLEAHDAVLLTAALLEVLRRWQWSFVRFETELRQLGALPSSTKGAAEAAAAAAAEERAGLVAWRAVEREEGEEAAGEDDRDWLDRTHFGGWPGAVELAGSSSERTLRQGAAGRRHAAELWGRRPKARTLHDSARSGSPGGSSGSGDEEMGRRRGGGGSVASGAAAGLSHLQGRHPRGAGGGGGGSNSGALGSPADAAARGKAKGLRSLLGLVAP